MWFKLIHRRRKVDGVYGLHNDLRAINDPTGFIPVVNEIEKENRYTTTNRVVNAIL